MQGIIEKFIKASSQYIVVIKMFRKYKPPLEVLLGQPMRKSITYPFDPSNLTRRVGDFRVFLSESGEDFYPNISTEYMGHRDKILYSIQYALNENPKAKELIELYGKKLENLEEQKKLIKKMRKAAFVELLRDLEARKKQEQLNKG